MGKFPLVEIQTFGVRSTFGRLTVNNEHARDLRQLSEDDLVVVFNAAHDAVFEQVAVAFILFGSRIDGGLILTWLLDGAIYFELGAAGSILTLQVVGVDT